MKNTKEIGGYFEFPSPIKSNEYHTDAIHLNSGRNALLYILKARKYKKIYLPYYICDSAIEPIQRLNIPYEFYNIDPAFFPSSEILLQPDEALLYVNYFGINTHNVNILAKKYQNIIVDNTQAFFQKPLNNIDTFYSARKFFHVTDGAYLYTTTKLEESLKPDLSYDRYEYVLKRYDTKNATSAYDLYLQNEKNVAKWPIKEMSYLTQSILSNIDYNYTKIIRERNFLQLHTLIGQYNRLEINTTNITAPMCYPFLIYSDNLREILIKNKIYLPTYWKEVLDRIDNNMFEYQLIKFLLPLPVDQRYTIEDMQIICELIKLNKNDL